jgi:hypothetical protein
MKTIGCVNYAPGQWNTHEGPGLARFSRKGVISGAGAEMLLVCSVAMAIIGDNNDCGTCRCNFIRTTLAEWDL